MFAVTEASIPTVGVRSVVHLGPAPILKGPGWTLVGQDGGQSIDLGNATLLVFSDTLLADPAALEKRMFSRQNARFLANCAGITTQNSFVNALASLKLFTDTEGWPREILPRTAQESLIGYRFWPQHGLCMKESVYLFYLGIRQVQAQSTWGFEIVGSGLAVLDPAMGDCERIRRDGEWRLWQHDGAAVQWGVQVLAEGEMAYIFGMRRDAMRRSGVLARVAIENIADLSTYEYLSSTEPAWSRCSSQLAEFAPCGGEYSVSFNRYLGRYLMIYVDGYDKTLYFRTAQQLWGPYSEPQCLGKLPHSEKTELVSLGFEHPQFARNGGKTVLVSYCQPHFTQNSLVSITFD